MVNEKTMFPYPMRGLSVLAIFLIVSPLVYVLVDTFRGHQWIGGTRVLIEFFEVFGKAVREKFLAAYSYYMPPAFIVGAWCAFKPARGAGLTLGGVFGRAIVAGFFFDLLFDIVIFYFQGKRLPEEFMVTAMLRWIISGWVCWAVAKKFRLDKAVVEKTMDRKGA